MVPHPLIVTDPTDAGEGPRHAVERWFVARLRDPRDLYFVRLALRMAAVHLPVAVALFLWRPPLWMAPLYFGFLGVTHLGPYTLMLHAVVHRPLFRREAAWLEGFIPWVLGPLFGQTPGSFHAHHVGMHHRENNGEDDLSGTTAYRRDSFAGFLAYWARFFFRGLPDLLRYLGDRRRGAMRHRLIAGEGSWLLAVAVLSVVNWRATAIVLVTPLVAMRFLMMAGNWAQHAFVDVTQPGNVYRNSTCLVNARYNRHCHNDGYHIVHHLAPGMHWTEMPRWFQDHVATFGLEDAVVFDGLASNQEVFWCLMGQRWGRLADALVDLPGAPVRTRDEKIAWLQARVRTRAGAGTAEAPTAAAGASA